MKRVEINVDDHKLIYHPERVAEWLEKGDCYPIYVEIGLTNQCNHRCIFCALDFIGYGGENIDKQIMLFALEDMATSGVKSIMFAGEGEPLLHKDVSLFVEKAKEYGLDVSITTNGIPLTQRKIEKILPHLSWIRFSIDSGSPGNYALIHQTSKKDFNKLIDNLEKIVLFKRANRLETTIGAQFLMIPQNMNEAVKLTQVVKEIGVDNLQIKPYSHHPKSLNQFHISPKEYDLLENELEQFNSDAFKIFFRRSTLRRIEEEINHSKCYGNSFFALVDSRGNIIPCNLFYGEHQFIYGNLYKNSFSEIWNSQQRKEVLRKLDEKGVEHCRKGCRLDAINRYLYRLINPSLHDNFI